MAQPFSKVWVIGLGTTGSAIAALLARNGLRVTGIEVDGEALLAGRASVRRHVERDTAEGTDLGPILDRVDYGTRLHQAWAPDLVIEALPERLDLKGEVLRQADALCAKETVFVTTTMGFSVTEIASRCGRMSRTVGLVSSHQARVGEVVRTPVTDQSVVDDIQSLVRSLDQTPVISHDLPGFVGNALILGYLNNAAAMYASGYASRDDIDAAMTLGCGLPIGPLAQLDAIGLDVVVDSLTALAARSGNPEYRPAPILSQMVTAGLLGSKTGRGFYTYGKPDADHVDAVEIEALARPVSQIGVVGSGIMASGIAEVCARAGYATTIASRTDTRAKEAVAGVERSLTRALQRGKLTVGDVDTAMANLTAATDLSGLSECDLVIEAVAEEIDLKQSVFAALDKLARPGAVLATTTSSLSVTRCATATTRPGDVMGMHFFNPAPAMKLVEVVSTSMTSPDVLATTLAVARSLGKTTVRCGDRTGFIVNALLFPYLNRAVHMLRDRHLGVSDIDTVMTGGYGFPLGPFQLLDIIGIDLSTAILNRLAEDLGEPTLIPAKRLTQLAEAGYLGRKTGRGFHTYA
jgi:3-hydroxybutyryl-CoA dehydrogenase